MSSKGIAIPRPIPRPIFARLARPYSGEAAEDAEAELVVVEVVRVRTFMVPVAGEVWVGTSRGV